MVCQRRKKALYWSKELNDNDNDNEFIALTHPQ